MGIISPDRPKKDEFEGLVSDTLKSMLRETLTTIDQTGMPVISSKADVLSRRLMDIALFCDSPKTSVSAAKLIMEYTEGKPAVKEVKEKTELPVVEFICQSVEDAEVIERKALTGLPEPEEPSFSLGEFVNG